MIRKMNVEDREVFYDMTKKFYNSESVLSDIPFQYHVDTFNELAKSNNYIQGYIFSLNDQVAGYALTSKYYSHEAGGLTLFVDELFVLEGFRSQGLGKAFFKYLKENVEASIVRLRLEVEADNKKAIKLYNNEGFTFLQYNQMIKDIEKGSL